MYIHVSLEKKTAPVAAHQSCGMLIQKGLHSLVDPSGQRQSIQHGGISRGMAAPKAHGLHWILEDTFDEETTWKETKKNM